MIFDDWVLPSDLRLVHFDSLSVKLGYREYVSYIIKFGQLVIFFVHVYSLLLIGRACSFLGVIIALSCMTFTIALEVQSRRSEIIAFLALLVFQCSNHL